MSRFLFLIFVIFSLASALEARDSSTESFLRQFHRNPKKMFNKIPLQIVDGQAKDRGFINAEWLDRNLLIEKEKLRNAVARNSIFTFEPLSAATEGDNVAALVDNGVVVTNILELDRRGVSSKSLAHKFWSDSYWPIAQGLLANRYVDAGNPHAKSDWSANYAYYLANPTFAISTNNLSPAEKYDLLVGDSNMTLTNYSWNRGRVYNDQYHGSVPSWMGICHGWSGATHMEAKIPFGSIVLNSPNGTPIRFYQSDVKGLISLLWANTTLPTRFLGYRCDIKPPRDGQGRTTDDKCRDNNPGTLFLALANQLGLNNRSFVMDATFDSEVWNYSVISYHSTYFNPQNFQQTDNLPLAILPIEQFTIDKFKKYRSPGTAYVVGVTMEVVHLNESGANHGVQTTPRTKTQRYIMDLELDSQYNIIGGEWYTRIHPDFIWTFAPGSQALAPGDADIVAEDWDVKGRVPPEWVDAARKSSKVGMPLYSVLKKIVEAAPKTPPANSSEELEDPSDYQTPHP